MLCVHVVSEEGRRTFVSGTKRGSVVVRYSAARRNCNHFTEALARKLLGASIPAWVNRSANVAAAFARTQARRATFRPARPRHRACANRAQTPRAARRRRSLRATRR